MIRAAVDTLCAERQITEMAAYELLVHAAADDHVQVRDIAMNILDQADRRGAGRL